MFTSKAYSLTFLRKWNKSIKKLTVFKFHASASASSPLTVSFSISLDLTGWKNVVIGRVFAIIFDQLRKQRRLRVSQSVNDGRRWRGKYYCLASRGEQIIRGFIFFWEGTVTNLAIWLVPYLVSIFLSLPTGHLYFTYHLLAQKLFSLWKILPYLQS